jgi:hypothetical protein
MSRRRLFQVLVAAMVTICLLALSGVSSAQGNSDKAFERVKEVQERNTAKLMAKAGVVGTAVGLNDKDQQAVLVLLEKGGVADIPQELEGVPVYPVVTGKIEALKAPGGSGSSSLTPTSRWPRPVPIGVSTGNANEVSAGTIGCRVKAGKVYYALSNNHVYARENQASLGERVVQPGVYDTPGYTYNPANDVGALAAVVTINFNSGTNTVDAAIATILNGTLADGATGLLVDKATPPGGYGTPNSSIIASGNVKIGMAVQKYGRTTSLTTGKVYALNATVNVNYGSGKTATFIGQIVIKPGNAFCRAGDSGSLIVTNDADCKPVGLLFAGGGSTTIANPIDAVLTALGISIDGK